MTNYYIKNFETLQQLMDYIPNCILCGKKMHLTFTCNVKLPTPEGKEVNNYVHFKLRLKDDMLSTGRLSRLPIIINPQNNMILKGLDYIKNINNNSAVTKSCNTCSFSIQTFTNSKIIGEQFPILKHTAEYLRYTLNPNKNVTISTYFTISNNPGTFITINHIRLPILKFLDFSQIKNLKHLNNKIKMLMVFQ